MAETSLTEENRVTTQEMKAADGTVQGVSLKAGEASVGLSQDDFAKGRNRLKGVGMSMYLETDQDIAALAAHAKAAGITLDAEPAPLPWGPIGFAVTCMHCGWPRRLTSGGWHGCGPRLCW